MVISPHSLTFSPGQIGKIKVKNRLVRSATYENCASETGEVTEVLVEMIRTLAKGGVGLIITGFMAVSTKDLYPHQPWIHHDTFIPGLKKLTDAVHGLGNDCKIVAQLGHSGRQVVTSEDMRYLLPHFPSALKKYLKQVQSKHLGHVQPPDLEATAPSAIFDPVFGRTPRALSLEEVDEIINAFAEGVRRAKEAGFDGVQLHAAHGYLLSSFLSPHTNRRDDQYGGSTENRTRIIREICQRARGMVGEDFPLLIKMNTTDFLPQGTDVEEAAKVAKILSSVGCAALETSGCMWETMLQNKEELSWQPYWMPESRLSIRNRSQEAYFQPQAKAVKSAVDVPVILVGGVKSLETVEKVLQRGAADFVAMSRPLIRQPDLPNLWLSGEGSQTAACISCNACCLLDAPLTCPISCAP